MGELVTAGKWCSTDAALIVARAQSVDLDCVDLIRPTGLQRQLLQLQGAGGDNICACLTADLTAPSPPHLWQFNLHAITADWQGTPQMPGSSATGQAESPGARLFHRGFSAQYGALTATWSPGAAPLPGFYIDRLGAYTLCRSSANWLRPQQRGVQGQFK